MYSEKDSSEGCSVATVICQRTFCDSVGDCSVYDVNLASAASAEPPLTHAHSVPASYPHSCRPGRFIPHSALSTA